MNEQCMKLARIVGESESGAILEVIVQPGSKREGIEVRDGEVIVRVREPPSEGRANDALIRLFRKKLKLKASIIAGAKSRKKKLLVGNASPEQVIEAICKTIR